VKLLCEDDCTRPRRAAEYAWVELDDPLPRARLLTKSTVAPDEGPISLREVDVAATAVVDRPLDLPEGSPGQAVLAEDRPGRIKVSVTLGSRQVLAVSESFHPGWRVSVDGVRGEVLPLYGDFIGCVVAPGTHVVEFSFSPASLRWGKVISLGGLAGLVLLPILSGRISSRAQRKIA